MVAAAAVGEDKEGTRPSPTPGACTRWVTALGVWEEARSSNNLTTLTSPRVGVVSAAVVALTIPTSTRVQVPVVPVSEVVATTASTVVIAAGSSRHQHLGRCRILLAVVEAAVGVTTRTMKILTSKPSHLRAGKEMTGDEKEKRER